MHSPAGLVHSLGSKYYFKLHLVRISPLNSKVQIPNGLYDVSWSPPEEEWHTFPNSHIQTELLIVSSAPTAAHSDCPHSVSNPAGQNEPFCLLQVHPLTNTSHLPSHPIICPLSEHSHHHSARSDQHWCPGSLQQTQNSCP